MKRLLAITLVFGALAVGQRAHAKTLATVSYPYERVFPAAVRFLHIDEGLQIVERDPEIGYILFELKDDGATFRGSFEVARVRDQDGRDASRLIVRIADRPAYMEQGLIDRFGLKLHEELGEPADPPAKDDKPPKHKRVAKGKD